MTPDAADRPLASPVAAAFAAKYRAETMVAAAAAVAAVAADVPPPRRDDTGSDDASRFFQRERSSLQFALTLDNHRRFH